jgi:hypothetical protein
MTLFKGRTDNATERVELAWLNVDGASAGAVMVVGADGVPTWDQTSAFPVASITHGTANQLLVTNSGATASVWTSTPTVPGLLTCQAGITATSPTVGLGYGTGAGGTVVQATNKSTGVTLSKVTGTITMNNAALNLDTVVTFTLTNTVIAATDMVLVEHASAGTVGAYIATAVAAASSAAISVTNVSAGNLSEAIVLRFVVIKSVDA